MNRHQLFRAIRAARDIAGVERVIVVGSQSILGSFDRDELPPEHAALAKCRPHRALFGISLIPASPVRTAADSASSRAGGGPGLGCQ